MSILDHPLISSRYFFPRREAPEKIVSVQVEGATLACAAFQGNPDAPWLVHFHGNGEVVADYQTDLTPQFLAAGLNVFLAEYRGYGASTGSPAMVKMLGDIPLILDAVGVPREKILVYGRSVGSLYAIEAAHRAPTIRGLVIESGIASPIERVLMRIRPDELGVSLADILAEARVHLDHEKKLSQFPGRTLILHTTHDSMVDVGHAKRNHSWAKDAELVLYDRGDHNDIIAWNRDDIVARIAQFVFSER
jgi:pimeloyl-ACP methyl ester carboxylesterase